MTPAQAAYLRRETVASAAINGVLSAGFVLLAFGGQALVGWRALAFDALPQSFAITLMATLVPTLLVRKRLRNGALTGLPPRRGGRVGSAPLRALLTALAVTPVAGLLHFALLPLGPAEWGFAAVLAGKVTYGAALGAAVGRLAVRRALHDGATTPPLRAAG